MEILSWSVHWDTICGTVGRAAASDKRDLRFESSLWQFYSMSTVLKRRKEKKKIRPGMAHLKEHFFDWRIVVSLKGFTECSKLALMKVKVEGNVLAY